MPKKKIPEITTHKQKPVQNNDKLERAMGVSESFIDYMKTMRDYYKSGAHSTDELPQALNFDNIEIDAHSYGFIPNSDNTTNNNTTKKYNPDIQETKKHNESDLYQPPVPTEITTIDLFADDDVIKNVNNNSPRKRQKQKTQLTTNEKIKIVFATLWEYITSPFKK